jgi:hypothetical protein
MAVAGGHMSTNLSPVRRFYRVLCERESPQDVHDNLSVHDDYHNKMIGDLEPRFCEWAYTRLGKRLFVDGLFGTVLRPSEILQMARESGMETEGLDPKVLLRKILEKFDIREPGIPDPVPNGIAVLEFYRDRFGCKHDVISIENTIYTQEPTLSCRRASERLLKLYAYFLYQSEFKDIFEFILEKNMPIHGFDKPNTLKNFSNCIKRGVVGVLNPLLRAVSKEASERQALIPFQRNNMPLWNDSLYCAFDRLNKALNWESHDSGMSRDICGENLHKSICDVLDLIEKEEFRVPRIVQFYRKYDDGHAIHYEGFLDNQEHLCCFESGEYQLHRPYLFLSATNPSTVDMVCVETDADAFFWKDI